MAKSPLSDADRKALRKALENKRDDLLAARERNIGVARTPDEEAQADPMDAATRASDEAEVLGLAHQERALLTEIDHALQKLDGGTYGVSEVSGKPIPIERLRAVPWARLTAQEEEELEHLR